MSILDYILNIFKNDKKNAQIYAQPLQKTYGEKEQLEIGLYDDKTPITDTDVTITLNGVKYNRKTDSNGIARLNINLNAREEPYTAILEFENNEYNKVKTITDITIKPKKQNTYIDGINLTMNQGDGSKYQCAVYDEQNQRIKDTVNITVNGITYNRKADNEGLYKLNINLNQGTYPIRAEYLGNEYYNPSSINNTIIINPKKETPIKTKTYSEEILDYFQSKFGKVSCIDDCLEKVQNRGYGYYYDDKLTNKQTIDGLATKGGTKPNCTDIHHVFWHLGKALGYDVRAIHVICKSGTGHVRLDFNRGNGWFSRDASSVADGNSITSIWCANGTIRATNPTWFTQNLNR